MSAPNPNLPTNSNPSPPSNSTPPRGDKRKHDDMQAGPSTSQDQPRKILKTATGKVSKPQEGAPSPAPSPTLNENAEIDQITLGGASEDEDEEGAGNQEGGAANQGEADRTMEEANNEIMNEIIQNEANSEDEDSEDDESERPTTTRTYRLSNIQAANMVKEFIRHGESRSLQAIKKTQKGLGKDLLKARKDVKKEIHKNIDGEMDRLIATRMNELVTQVNGQLGAAWLNQTEELNTQAAIKLSKKEETIKEIIAENQQMQDMIEGLSEQKNILEARVVETRTEIEAKSEQLGNAENALRGTARELVTARARNEETERKLQEAEDNLGRIDNENVQIQERHNRDNIEYQLELEELRQQLSDANLERETANLRLVEMEANIQHAETVIQDYEQRATAMQNTINAKNQAIKGKEALLQSAQAQVVATNANLEHHAGQLQCGRLRAEEEPMLYIIVYNCIKCKV